MTDRFDPHEYTQGLAKRLVFEFSEAAQAPTPGLKGAAREHPARKQLERLLPSIVAVGSGIVIDSFGGQSRQQDIVIFERNLCPIYSINDTPEATFYPVEGVVAVGEVKSVFGGKEISDSFANIESVKSLRRHALPTDDGMGLGATVGYRNYGSLGSFVATLDTQFNPAKESDQVFAFTLFGTSSLLDRTLFDHLMEHYQRRGAELCPNIVGGLDRGFFQPYDRITNTLTHSRMSGDHLGFCPESRLLS